MSRKRRYKSSYSFQDAKSRMCHLLHTWCYSGTKEIEISWQLLMFPIKFKARTGRLSGGSKGQLQPISSGNRDLNWKKVSAEPLQDQRAATATGTEMLLGAWVEIPRTPERFSELWYNSHRHRVSYQDCSTYGAHWKIFWLVKNGRVK